VTASPAPGSVRAGTTLTLATTTSNATIYYTTDGSDPKAPSAKRMRYSSPIVANTLTVRAYATAPGMADSAVSSLAYTLDGSSVVDVRAHGAKANDGVDDSAAIRAAISAARSAGKAVFIPAGTFHHHAELVFNGVDLLGTGSGSILHATNPEAQSVRIQGAGVTVNDLRLTTSANTSGSENEHQRMHIDGATDFIVERVTVEGARASGIYTSGGRRGVIRDNTVRNPLKSGIYTTRAASHITIESNSVTGTGADLISVVSFQSHGPDPVNNIILRGNQVSSNTEGCGLCVQGGHTFTLEDNAITAPHAAGIFVSADGSLTHGLSNVMVRRNTVDTAGNTTLGHGALMVRSSGSLPVTDITFTDNTVHNARKMAVHLTGSAVGTVHFTNNLLRRQSGDGIYLAPTFKGTATFTGNVVEEAGGCGFVHASPDPAASITLDGNTFRNTNTSGSTTWNDVIHFQTGSLKALTLTNNTHENPGGHVLEYFIEEHVNAAAQTLSGNCSPLPSWIDGRQQSPASCLVAASVTASPAPGSVRAGTTLTLATTTPNATIYYTTDGSDPKAPSAKRMRYSSPIVANTLTVRAYATAPGMADSAVSSLAYTLDGSSVVDITVYDAKANDGVDDSVGIKKAIGVARSDGKAVFIPAGTFHHDAELVFDGVDLLGTGSGSILHATNLEQQNVRIEGAGVTVSDLTLSSSAMDRKQGNTHQRLNIDRATDFIVERVTVDGSRAAGIFNYGGSNGVIRGNTVRNTNADGIHNTRAASNILIEYNTVENTRDDLIAVVSYQDHGGEPVPPVSNVTIRENMVSGSKEARGITVLGGRSITVEGNTVKTPAKAGIYVGTESSYKTQAVSDVIIRRNTVSGAGSSTGYHGALMVYSSNSHPVDQVDFIDNTIENARWRGIFIQDINDPVMAPTGSLRTLRFTGNNVRNTTNSTAIVVAKNFRGTLVFEANTIDTTRNEGYRQEAAHANARITLNGNMFRDINQSGNQSVDAILLQGGSLEALTLTNNVHENPSGYSLEYFIEEHVSVPAAAQVISGNSSAVNSRIDGATVPTP
jgi:parallel beta-helix repeat protein